MSGEAVRTGKQLLAETKHFAGERRAYSWWCLASTYGLLLGSMALATRPLPLSARLPLAIVEALLIVRTFMLFHDHLHGALLLVHGAMDDNVMNESKVTKHYLRDAVDALLAGKAPAFSRASAVALDLERQIAAILSILDDEQIPRPEWPQKIAASVVDVLVRAGSEQPTGRIPAPKSQAGNFSRPSPCAIPKAVNHALAIRAPSHMRKLFPTFCC